MKVTINVRKTTKKEKVEFLTAILILATVILLIKWLKS